MIAQRVFSVVFAVIAVAIGMSEAQAQGMKPGLWQVEQQISIPGAPPELLEGAKQRWSYCVRPEEAKEGPKFRPEQYGEAPDKMKECRIENLKTSPGHTSYDIACPNQRGASRIRVEYRYTDTSFEGTSRLLGKETMSWRMKGQYLGACPEAKKN